MKAVTCGWKHKERLISKLNQTCILECIKSFSSYGFFCFFLFCFWKQNPNWSITDQKNLNLMSRFSDSVPPLSSPVCINVHPVVSSHSVDDVSTRFFTFYTKTTAITCTFKAFSTLNLSQINYMWHNKHSSQCLPMKSLQGSRYHITILLSHLSHLLTLTKTCIWNP